MPAKKKGKPDAIEQVSNAASAMWQFLRASYRPYGVYLVRFTLLALVLQLVLIAGVVAFLGGISTVSGAGLYVIIALVVVGYMGYIAVYQALHAAALVGTRDLMEKKPVPSVLKSARQYFVPATKYTIVTMVALIALIALAAVPLAGGSSAIVLFLITLVAALGILLIAAFLIQFGFWELIIGGRGVWDSIRASFHLVRNNLLAVFLFDVLAVVVTMAIAIPFVVLSYVVQFGSIALTFANPVLGMVVSILASLVIGLVETLLISMAILPLTYAFWKNIRRDVR